MDSIKSTQLKKEYQRIYYLKNKEHMLAQMKGYRKQNWEKVKGYMSAWRVAHPERWQAIHKKSAATRKAKKDAYRASHPELYHKVGNRWYPNKRKSKYAHLTPEQKEEQRKLTLKRYQSKPDVIENHRKYNRERMRRIAKEIKEQKEFAKQWREKEKIKLLNNVVELN